MQDVKQQFAQQLRQAMIAAGYAARPSVLERGFNTRHWGKPMSLHGVRRWLQGETMPDLKKMETLAKWLGVTVQQLSCSGALAHKAEQRRARWDSGIGYEDRDVFEAYLKLPVPQRRLIRETILTFAKVHSESEKPAGK